MQNEAVEKIISLMISGVMLAGTRISEGQLVKLLT